MNTTFEYSRTKYYSNKAQTQIFKCSACGHEVTSPRKDKLREGTRRCLGCVRIEKGNALIANKHNIVGRVYDGHKILDISAKGELITAAGAKFPHPAAYRNLVGVTVPKEKEPKSPYKKAAKLLGVSRQSVWAKINESTNKEKHKQEIYEKTGIRFD
jgi:hypothetical protein